MTTPSATRVAGKLGRLTAQFPEGLHDLTHYAAGSLPAAPASVEVPDFANWGVLSNDVLGDCGIAGLQHLMEAAATDAGETGQWPSDKDAGTYYLDFTGGADTGVVLSQFLAYVRQHGYYGHTVTAYAPVSVHDVPTLSTAIYMYDGVYCGITVTQAMMDAFQNGQPWDLNAVQGEPAGGHCVPAVAYDDTGLTVITWGQPQVITWPAWHAISSEAWAVITGELAGGDGHGIALDALTADLDKLNGPVPAPANPPHKGLLGELVAYIRRVEDSASQDVGDIVQWLDRHHL